MSFETNGKKPVIEFIADETQRASGLYGLEAILSDLTEIAKMFDSNSVHDRLEKHLNKKAHEQN